jgi:hypothetical protein
LRRAVGLGRGEQHGKLSWRHAGVADLLGEHVVGALRYAMQEVDHELIEGRIIPWAVRHSQFLQQGLARIIDAKNDDWQAAYESCLDNGERMRVSSRSAAPPPVTIVLTLDVRELEAGQSISQRS